MMNFLDMHGAVDFYQNNGFRVMPLFGIQEKCKHIPVKPELDCRGQCWGKVPMERHWPEKDFLKKEDFSPGCNLAIILGEQLDGRWFVGLDIDGEFNLEEFLVLPPTLQCSTRRGTHLIFEVMPDTALGNWNDIFSTRSKTSGYRLDYTGAVDIKYCRGAMTSPPSRTRDGLEYSWLEWMQPTMMPDSEISFLKRKRQYSFPKIKRYRKWSQDPTHFGKRP
jgi:hypothetical protein